MKTRLVIMLIMAGLISGCATTKRAPTAVNQLQIRVAQLENQIEMQDQEIADLKSSIGILGGHVSSVVRAGHSVNTVNVSQEEEIKETSYPKNDAILRVSASPLEVQTALKNAGYYTGAIDGKLGGGSQRAIKSFQADHELKSDGIIGKNTWQQLKTYLE